MHSAQIRLVLGSTPNPQPTALPLSVHGPAPRPLQEELEKLQKEKEEREVAMLADTERLKREVDEGAAQHRHEVDIGEQARAMLSEEKQLLEEQVGKLTEEHAKKDRDNFERSNTYKGQIVSLKNEIEGVRPERRVWLSSNGG